MESEILQTAASDHKSRPGLRVMRTSPGVLISCGLIFVSLIFVLDFMTQTGTTSAQRASVSNAQQNSQAAPASAPEPIAQPSATTPEPKPSVEVATLGPEAEPEKQPSSPAPAAPETINTQASSATPPSPAPAQSEDGFTLQIGSYNKMAQAQERVAKLGSFSVSAYVSTVEIPKRGTWYRVQTGHFSSREEAVRYGTQLRSKGAVADYIVTPSKAS